MGATFQGELHGAGLRIGLVVARFNEAVTLRLLEGARTALERHGVRDEDVDVAWVPGAFELPLIAKQLADSRRYDAVVCLGAVIRGETAHFDFVAGEAARGVTQVALETGVPVMFGVLTPDTLEQAMERSGGSIGNRGYDAALGAIEMANLMRGMRPD
jgi:6,7-dimethyl-8-ribityllumazine synthase